MTDSTQEIPEPARRKSPPWWLVFMLSTLVFMFGAVFGAVLVVAIFLHAAPARFDHPEHHADRMTSHLSRTLDLSEEQQNQVRDILREQFEELGQIRRETKPRVEATLNDTFDSIKEILTPEQAEQWDERFERMRRRLRAPGWDRPRGPHRGPGERGSWFDRGGHDSSEQRPGPEAPFAQPPPPNEAPEV